MTTTRIHGIRCTKCGDEIWSRHRHDFRYCGCGETFIDGGRDYIRCGGSWEPVEIEINESELPSPRTREYEI